MEALVLQLLPSLSNHYILLYITEVVFTLFFGSFIYSMFFGWLNK